MESLIDRYDELENIVDTLSALIKEIQDQYYKDLLEDIKTEAFGELEDTEAELRIMEDEEKSEMIINFERSRV